MAFTTFGVNDPLAVKTWSKVLAVEASKGSEIAPLIGTGDNAIIQQKTELTKGKGDQITIGLRMQLIGEGFTENETAEGNGETLAINTDKLVINELGHVVGVKSENTIDAQRVPFNLREQAKDGLADWFGTRMATVFFNHVCGYTPETRLKFTGNNAILAPTAGRIVRAGGAANDGALSSSNTMTLSLIDAAVEIAKTGGSAGLHRLRPARVDGEAMYVLYLHPTQTTALRTNTSAGQWLDIQKAAMQGGKVRDNPIFTGALGVYNGVVLRESQQVTLGVSTTNTAVANTRRAVLLGAQSAVVAFGQNSGPTKYRWNEELYDHKRNLEVSAWSIYGLKKTQYYNAVDFGTIVIPTYAAPAA